MDQPIEQVVKPGAIVTWYNPLLHRDIVGLVLDEPFKHEAQHLVPRRDEYWHCSLFVEGKHMIKELTKDVKVIKTADKNIN